MREVVALMDGEVKRQEKKRERQGKGRGREKEGGEGTTGLCTQDVQETGKKGLPTGRLPP